MLPAETAGSRRRIRVAQVITSVVLGGGGQFISALARSIDRESFEMDVYCVLEGGEWVDYLRSLGFRVEVFPICRERGLLRYDLRLWLRLARELRLGRYDIVHTSLFRADLVGAVAARVTGNRIVIKTLHNMGTRKRRYHRTVDTLLNRITRRVVCVSETQRQALIGREGLRTDNTLTIRNGVQADRMARSVNRSLVAASVGLDPNRPIVGTVGRLIQEKGHTWLVKAMPEIARRHPAVQFLIVGDGPLRQALELEIGALGRLPVVITGLRPDVPELLGIMDVFAFPSLSEGLPIAALEAMAAGVPLACSDIPALQEIVTHRQTGLIFAARDTAGLAAAVSCLLSDLPMRKALAARARMRVERDFSESVMARAYEDLYRAELARHGR